MRIWSAVYSFIWTHHSRWNSFAREIHFRNLPNRRIRGKTRTLGVFQREELRSRRLDGATGRGRGVLKCRFAEQDNDFTCCHAALCQTTTRRVFSLMVGSCPPRCVADLPAARQVNASQGRLADGISQDSLNPSCGRKTFGTLCTVQPQRMPPPRLAPRFSPGPYARA